MEFLQFEVEKSTSIYNGLKENQQKNNTNKIYQTIKDDILCSESNKSYFKTFKSVIIFNCKQNPFISHGCNSSAGQDFFYKFLVT